jgi:tellurite methyltransferase
LLRRITGFHQDDKGDGVAELDCLHSQHVRHRPPFQDRPWVLTEAGRTERLGTELDCPLCDRAELPEGLVIERTAGPFDETTLPAGLLRAHRLPAGTWGRLRILDGAVDFRIGIHPPVEHHLDGGQTQPIPPEVTHELRPKGPLRLVVDFLRRP